MMKGKAFKFGDSISTDHIQPGRYSYLRSNLNELAKHTLEDVDPPLQVSLGLTYLAETGGSFNGNVSAGLTESAPDIGVSLGWQVPL